MRHDLIHVPLNLAHQETLNVFCSLAQRTITLYWCLEDPVLVFVLLKVYQVEVGSVYTGRLNCKCIVYRQSTHIKWHFANYLFPVQACRNLHRQIDIIVVSLKGTEKPDTRYELNIQVGVPS